MSLLIFSLRRQQIISLKNSINFKLLQLNQKMMDLQSYAAAIADGNITAQDMVSVAPSLFNRMSNFLNYSRQMAYAGANEKFGPFMAMNQASVAQVPAELQGQYRDMIFKGLYDQERKAASDTETRLLNLEEKRIEQETARLQTQLKMLDAEQEQVTKAEDDAAKKAAPQYVA